MASVQEKRARHSHLSSLPGKVPLPVSGPDLVPFSHPHGRTWAHSIFISSTSRVPLALRPADIAAQKPSLSWPAENLQQELLRPCACWAAEFYAVVAASFTFLFVSSASISLTLQLHIRNFLLAAKGGLLATHPAERNETKNATALHASKFPQLPVAFPRGDRAVLGGRTQQAGCAWIPISIRIRPGGDLVPAHKSNTAVVGCLSGQISWQILALTSACLTEKRSQ